MEVIETPIAGLCVVKPRVFRDERGFFLESYNAGRFAEAGLPTVWAQDNHARSGRGTLRGLHFQRGAGQAKLVRCTIGRIWDVAVDIRPGSPTLGQWYGRELTGENFEMLMVPTGFAHGYCVLSETADVHYKCDRLYDAELESGFAWDDPDVAVNWPIEDPLLSVRDQNNPSYQEILATMHSEAST